MKKFYNLGLSLGKISSKIVGGLNLVLQAFTPRQLY